MAKNFDTRPLSSALGTEIIGLDVSDRIDEDTITELLDVWVDGIVLLFRKPNMTQEEQLRFASCFGKVGKRPKPLDKTNENYDELDTAFMLVSNIRENGKPIESGGKLITGERFSDVASLKRILATNRKEDFYRCLSEKLLTFAIGRGVEYYDAPTIDFLVKRLESKQGNLRELIYGIIESAPFQKRRGAE